jgi:hypothetical protein
MVAAKLANLDVGGNQHSEGTSIEGAANLLHVGRASVERAKAVRRSATPEVVAAVEQGHLALSVAAKLATLTQRGVIWRVISPGVGAGFVPRAQHEIDAVAIEGDRHEAARQTDQTSLRL